MKTIIFIALTILTAAVAAQAAPFLVCDPYPVGTEQPTEFRIVYGATTVTSPAETLGDGTKRLHWDLAPLVAGTYNITVTAVRVDSVWGNQESVPVPFSFTKPVLGPLSSPANIKLSK